MLIKKVWMSGETCNIKCSDMGGVLLLRIKTKSNLYNPGDLLVTTYKYDESQTKVIRYSEAIEKQTIQFDEEGKALYSSNNKVKFINENRNLDIYVADLGADAVVVVNHDGKLRFRYSGQP